MKGVWVLTVYDEQDTTGPQKLHQDLAQSLRRVADYYDYPDHMIVVRNIGDTVEDIDFTIVDKNGEDIGDLEFHPEGYVSMSMGEASQMALDLGCTIEPVDPEICSKCDFLLSNCKCSDKR